LLRSAKFSDGDLHKRIMSWEEQFTRLPIITRIVVKKDMPAVYGG
jgi:hypothetical protein